MKILKGHSKMKTHLINNISKFTRRLFLGSLMLFGLAGNALAQTDQPYVIKLTNYNNAAGDHYLAHVKVGQNWVLQDATTFSPDCLWYSGREISLSGTNHNYYFIDDNNHYRFLSAPLEAGGTLGLSDSQPPVYLLNNTDHNYYFYDWDYDNRPQGAGVARGHQYNGVTNNDECTACGGNMEDGECWEVYWVECNNGVWKLSGTHHYNITETSGRFRLVTDTPIDMQITEGGLNDLASFNMDYPNSHSLSATIEPFSYIPACHKYDFDEVTVPGTQGTSPTLLHHTYYYPFGETNTNPPTESESSGDSNNWTYNWTISGEGAEYLSFTNEGEMSHTSSLPAPTLYYRTVNNTGDKQATLTLTVTYSGESRQTKSATVTVKTPCQNPSFSANVNYEGVTISWTPTAEHYVVSWKKQSDSEWQTATVDSPETSFFLDNLEYATTYDYKVKATCDSNDPTPLQFTTLHQPKAVVGGAVFGGGRMANVDGKTEVVIINTDSIGAVYGGNDIAGAVLGAAGSTIKLGVTADDPDAVTYNNSQASTKVRVGDVYGGGNGYYAYDGSTFVRADDDHTFFPVSPNGTVRAMTQSHQVGEVVWTNTTGNTYTMIVPKITKTNITVANNAVKADSIFGGAKNAFITNTNANDGTSITIDGGTAFAVFGGNNFGGNQTAGKHHIEVNDTKTDTESYPNGLGHDYGICYVFGGGNKVQGLTTEVIVEGGMCDTVFAGGNFANVGDAHVLINCTRAKTFTDAVSSWTGDDNVGEINDSYAWNGTGLYNVRALFGGNNRADMEGLPTVTLTSGSVGTVYGGGNSGRMLAQTPETSDKPIATEFGANYIGNDELPIYYGTHVTMESSNMLVDYLYGGCQMSDVLYSTWVEVLDGHVGTVYGGCNIGGDVGSTCLYSSGSPEQRQAVQGATYVKAAGGTIYGDLFAGSNGYYHCNDGVHYVAGLNFSDQYHVGKTIPSHNETHVLVTRRDANHAVVVKGNVYAGGNLAYVGFINSTTNGNNYPTFRGFASLRMNAGRVEGNVYGGGNRASIFGSNEVKVSGGSIGFDADGQPTGGALYGGNDKSGQVAQITNRVFPESEALASDYRTSLRVMGVKTYVDISGKPHIFTVYGGGNGAYDYTPDQYCDVTDQPVQSNTFVDINIDAAGGAEQGGYINTVYGGGNGVTVLDRITVFLNVQNTANNMYDHVGTIFGGNNMGDLDILSDIVFVNGQVNTVYGGCNEGAMLGSFTVGDYTNVGSLIHRGTSYTPVGTSESRQLNGIISGYAYGGCRSNGVTNNTLVLVEGGDHHTATFFGGSDVSGIIGGESHVVVTGGSTGTVYGGGNGYYDYSGGGNPPYSTSSRVDVLGGTCAGSVYGGGLAGKSGETHVTINNDGSVGNNVFGGGNEAGVVAENGTTGNSTITMEGGFVANGIYGGCNALGNIDGDVLITLTNGQVGRQNAHANIHGGGYGQQTNVVKNVTVNFGTVSADGNPNLVLFGDLYGGSAFGHVNTADENEPGATTTTNVNLNNGRIVGAAYGGGLGQKAGVNGATTDIEPFVYGRVYLKVGDEPQAGTYTGQADLVDCDVYGCNNLNGTPKSEIYVDVYQTAHTPDNVASNIEGSYAIHQVFGGGNQAAYTEGTNRTNVYIHGCLNTIYRTFGGSNAAEVYGTNLTIDGGRFNEVFGGGNGEVLPADVGVGGIAILVKGGYFNVLFNGSNQHGTISGTITYTTEEGPCGSMMILDHFLGSNQADIFGDVTATIKCGDAMSFVNLYCGSNRAQIYGNIDVVIKGGVFENVYGGSKGQLDPPYSSDIHTITQDIIDAHPNEHLKLGEGGNITLTINGGTIGNLFGSCNLNGNAEGKISIIVDDERNSCGLFIGNIYGGGNVTNYTPINANIRSPKIMIHNATVGGHTSDLPINPSGASTGVDYDGNVFGGGCYGNVTSQPEVIVGNGLDNDHSKVNIMGNVYGGGMQGKVIGNADVVVVPKTHNFTYSQPAEGGTIRVIDSRGSIMSAGTTYALGEHLDYRIVAIPNIYGYGFGSWTVNGEGASVANEQSVSSTFTMGTADASLTATFQRVSTKTLTVTQPANGSITVKDGLGNTIDVTQPITISVGAVLTFEATPASGYKFTTWQVSAGNGYVTHPASANTTFVMGDQNTTITANFEETQQP